MPPCFCVSLGIYIDPPLPPLVLRPLHPCSSISSLCCIPSAPHPHSPLVTPFPASQTLFQLTYEQSQGRYDWWALLLVLQVWTLPQDAGRSDRPPHLGYKQCQMPDLQLEWNGAPSAGRLGHWKGSNPPPQPGVALGGGMRSTRLVEPVQCFDLTPPLATLVAFSPHPLLGAGATCHRDCEVQHHLLPKLHRGERSGSLRVSGASGRMLAQPAERLLVCAVFPVCSVGDTLLMLSMFSKVDAQQSLFFILSIFALPSFDGLHHLHIGR